LTATQFDDMASEPAPAAAAAAVPAVVATAAAVAPIAPVAPVVTGGAGASTSSAARASAGPSTAPSGSALASAGLTASQIAAMTGAKMEVPSRRSFVHEGREIYEWEQTLDDVNVYIKPPPGVKASMLDCKITSTHVSLGLKGNPPFINVRRQAAGPGAPQPPSTHLLRWRCMPNGL